MASTYLTRTPASTGNRRTFTFSAWVKRSSVGGAPNTFDYIFDCDAGGTQSENKIGFVNDKLSFGIWNTDTTTTIAQVDTNRLFRDTSGYYHIVCAVDTTQAVASDRIKFYVNGVQETSLSTSTYMAQDYDTGINTQNPHAIGRWEDGASRYYDGLMGHVNFCDGLALAPTVFGSTDATTGEWEINTSPSFTLGTNGFSILKNGNTITDQSTNSNNWTLGAGTLTNTEDCPDDVFATFNPLENYWQQGTYSNGNNTYQANTSNYTYNSATIGVSKGKFYWEIEYEAKSSSNDDPLIGITSTQPTNTNNELGKYVNDWGYYEQSGTPYYRNNSANTSYGTTYNVGDVICVALDADNNKLYFRINGGSWENSGDPTSGATGTGAISITAPSSTPLGAYFPSVCFLDGSSNGTFKANFGNGYFGTTIISSEGTNASGIGKFEYDVPTGYTALSTKGLQE
jgi:hypothetical protein